MFEIILSRIFTFCPKFLSKYDLNSFVYNLNRIEKYGRSLGPSWLVTQQYGNPGLGVEMEPKKENNI